MPSRTWLHSVLAARTDIIIDRNYINQRLDFDMEYFSLHNKMNDDDFINFICNFEAIHLSETWSHEGYKHFYVAGIKLSQFERATGGVILFIKDNISKYIKCVGYFENARLNLTIVCSLKTIHVLFLYIVRNFGVVFEKTMLPEQQVARSARDHMSI